MTTDYMWVAGIELSGKVRILGHGSARFTACCKAIQNCTAQEREYIEEWKCQATDEEISKHTIATVRGEYVTLD